LLVIAWSQVTILMAFYLIWIGLGACAAAILYEPAFVVIAQWFTRERGTALAIITFAAGLASTIFLPLSDALLHAFGWRIAVLLLGLFLGVMTIPLHALMLRGRSAGMHRPTTDTPHTQVDVSFNKAVRSPVFWLLTASFGLAVLATAAIRVHFIPFLISTGIPSSTAAFATGSIGIMQVVGRVIFAPLERRWSSGVLLVGIFVLQAAAMIVLLVGQTPVLIGLFIIPFGAAQGAMTLARPALLAELYGSAHYGRISSVMAIFLTIAGTSAPLGASLVFDTTHSYQPVLWIVVVIAAGAAIMAYIAKRYAEHQPAPYRAGLVSTSED
jgi:predicted MFS family arabinose efflux permease